MSGKGSSFKGRKPRNRVPERFVGNRNRKKDVYQPPVDFPAEKFKHFVEKCRSKVPYGSYQNAISAKKVLEQRYGVEYSPYECPICGKWHLTTHPWA